MENIYRARFFDARGGLSNDTIGHGKDLLVSTMKTLIQTFDDWDGFEIEYSGKIIYKYLKDYEKNK